MKTTTHLAAKNTLTNLCVQCYKRFVAEIEDTRARIVNEFRENLDSHGNLFRLALNEAEFLASQTEYPHLVFPALAMEKVQAVKDWRARQYAIRQNRPAFANIA
jgi:hypothetical protein